MGLTTDPTDPGLNNILPDGKQEKYLILSDEEIAKGFIRPYRDEYIHLKCGTVTRMGEKLSETYARQPSFYGGTYCVTCGTHFPLKDGEGKANFLWTKDHIPVGD